MPALFNLPHLHAYCTGSTFVSWTDVPTNVAQLIHWAFHKGEIMEHCPKLPKKHSQHDQYVHIYIKCGCTAKINK